MIHFYKFTVFNAAYGDRDECSKIHPEKWSAPTLLIYCRCVWPSPGSSKIQHCKWWLVNNYSLPCNICCYINMFLLNTRNLDLFTDRQSPLQNHKHHGPHMLHIGMPTNRNPTCVELMRKRSSSGVLKETGNKLSILTFYLKC